VFLTKLSQKEKENALNEVRILASIDDPNIVAYKEAFLSENPSTLCIVMEYADGGDLYDRILKHQKKGTKFSEKEIWDIFIQVVRGLKALHNLKILHRDLKSANVFLNKDGTVKLGDLNVSKVAKMGLVHTQTGTPYYASPEVWEDKSYDFRSDIWSLGVCTYEMATLKPPFTASSMQELYKRVLTGKYPKIPSDYSRDLSSIISTLLTVKPSERPSCEQILHMPAVEEHMTEDDEEAINKELLNTIKIPRNMKLLQGKLPKSNYEDEKMEEMDDVADLGSGFNGHPLANPHSSSVSNILEKPAHGDIIKPGASLGSSAKENESILREIRSRHGIDSEAAKKLEKKKRKNPRTTPMNIELASNKPSKYQMYRNLNSRSRKDSGGMEPIRYGSKNVHEKYAKRAREVEEQERKLKRELQNRVEDSDLPQIYKKGKVGVQRVLYDPRYESGREYLKSSHKYGIESENNRKPSLMLQPRIISHNLKEGLSSRGNLVDSVSPPSSKGLIPYGKNHPYKNQYSVKNHKLAKLKGLPPASSKYSGKLEYS
jgi:serine/threonine protein kinase